ncbi:ribulose-phosphate 3-epimerase [Candidatus Allofournierella excrementavium]|uniref:ribulose-phosphate 3-epimerase n=1 Tax=Candidatus Allofournierella excrementavium TaxID=2838591 RepID=UPI003AB6B5A7
MLYSPSLACADQLALASDIRQLMDCGLTTLHFDVMDGHYVPNLCLSLDTAASIRAAFPQAVLDVHLMATSPELYIDRLHDVGADYVTFHQNATSFALRTIASIHSAGMRAGVALNPSQRPEELLPLLPHTDLVLVMSIEPGFSGQKFMPHTLRTVAELDRIRTEQGLDFVISVDGGINADIGRQLKDAGADWLVLGYPAIFRQPDGIRNSFRRFADTVENNEMRCAL